MRVAGIDEVGYGSRLGPFIVCATVFEVPRRGLDLWRALEGAVSRTPDPERLVVADSKEVFTQRKGIASLERTVLSFLGGPQTLGELCRRVGARLETPWFRDLPLSRVGGTALSAAMERVRVRFVGARAVVLEARAFNEGLRRVGNKHELHFQVVARLLCELLKDECLAEVKIGKLSGRTFYASRLAEVTGELWTPVLESRARSTYVSSREVTVSFVRDGDRSEFTIALASMIAKYLRECCMIGFNEYWTRRVEGLERTAGYGAAAARWFRKIESHLGELQPMDVYREK